MARVGPRTIGYAHDAASNRTAVTWPDGFSATYAYDGQNRVTAVKEKGTAVLATYSYDALDRRVSLTLGNRRMVTYAYEPDGALDVLSHKGLVGGVDAVWNRDYNAANRIVARSTSGAAQRKRAISSFMISDVPP
ncbi:MAG: hypothetical protein ACE5ED_12355 [Rhodothalassiaceae bacterium]